VRTGLIANFVQASAELTRCARDKMVEDLWFNRNAAFTKWVTSKDRLREPFVLIDIGVQGDVHPRWSLLDDHLVVHGFDAIEETITNLKRANTGNANRHYYNFAIGDADQEAAFYFNPANPTNSSMFSQGVSRYNQKSTEQARRVNVRRLDTLFAEQVIPRADFVKVDVEGFEKSVFMGGRNLLTAGVLGVEAETNFGISPVYPKGHFSAISEILIEHGLLAFDLSFNRLPRASFTQALHRRGIDIPSGIEFGKPALFNVLFCRDLIDECDLPQNYVSAPKSVTVDQIIKMMIVYELYGLNDIALDTAVRFTDALSTRFDVDELIGLLASVECRPTDERLRALLNSTSWRITAPLRAMKLGILKMR
jgi:FkbM family methyltransferase